MENVTATYADLVELVRLHPELSHELHVIILERHMIDRDLEILRLTDLAEALQEPTLAVDPEGEPEKTDEPPE